MDAASEVTIGSSYRRHSHQEFLRFRNDIEDKLRPGWTYTR
jgi:hypothetical protein